MMMMRKTKLQMRSFMGMQMATWRKEKLWTSLSIMQMTMKRERTRSQVGQKDFFRSVFYYLQRLEIKVISTCT